jgi:hypothetical protein
MEARVDVRVEAFDNLIKQKGIPVKWQQAMFCHCVSRDTGQPSFNCPVCRGTGFYYGPAVSTTVAITSITGKMDLQTDTGILEKGTANISTLSTDLMGYNDRLEFPDFSSKYSELIQFNEEGISQPFHKKIKSILKLISPNCPAEGWKADLDFKVNEDDWGITWIGGIKPSFQDTFSVLYVTSPTYLISEVLHELRGSIVGFKNKTLTFYELPKQFQIRREDFSYVWR